MPPYNFVILRSPIESLINAFNVPLTFRPIFMEGVYLASSDFYNQFKKIDQLNDVEKSKIETSLLKYWVRSSMRCTPFGTFAGNAVIPLSERSTKIILNDVTHHDRKIRLDMGYIHSLINEIEKLPALEDQILLFSNNSIYCTPLDVRYAESFMVNFQRDYKLTAVEKSNYLLFVIEKAKDGISISCLSSLLSVFSNVNIDEAKQFIMEMWRSQLLVSELEPCLTGEEPFERLISLIKKYQGVDFLSEQLNDIFNYLKNPKEGADFYIEAENRIKRIFNLYENGRTVIQTDLFLSCLKREINKKLVNSIINQVEDLLYMGKINNNTELDRFKKKFLEKFGNKKIPLTIALDSDLGIGYAGIYENISGGNSLIDDIEYYTEAETKQSYKEYINDFTFNKYLEYINGNDEYIEISEAELNSFKINAESKRFPTSLYVMGGVMKKSNKLDEENFLFDLTSIGGPSGGNLLGRFTHGDKDLLDRTKEILLEEEKKNPEIIFAEIVHLPQARIGNVLLRPILRNYEIPYVGKSGIQLDNQIFITDLYLCIRNDEIVLISKKHNRRVIPRLTTAHNFSLNSLPIYKFLCDLQNQNSSIGLIWDWASLDRLKHLPRVMYKNIILKRARWKIELSDIAKLPNIKDAYKVFFEEFISIKGIPSKVLLTEGDNQILIDFNIQASIMIFLNYLRKNKNVLLEEFLFSDENCIVKDSIGSPYTNEIIIPFHHVTGDNENISIYKFDDEIIDKKYCPGSEWLFFNVFCSAKTADKILKEYLLPFIETGEQANLFDLFFFLRYNEGGSHLRIRFYNHNIAKQNEVLFEFMNLFGPLLKSNVIERITVDTYVQETQRYGGHNLIEEAEALFNVDSLATLKILDLLESGIENNYRVLFGIRGLDILMDDFNLSLFEKRELSKKMFDRFFKEFGSSPALQKNLNTKFKNLKEVIFSHMDSRQDSNNEITEVVEIFRNRSMHSKEIINRIVTKLAVQHENILFDLLASYFHMSINRLFISQQRKYELVIYHFLERYYTSKIYINAQI